MNADGQLHRIRELVNERFGYAPGDTIGMVETLLAAWEELHREIKDGDLVYVNRVADSPEFAASAEIPDAVVVTILEGKVIGRQALAHDDYVVICGPDADVTHINTWSSGTTQLTIKRGAAARCSP